MDLRNNLGQVYYILPFLGVVRNKYSLIFSIIFGFPEFRIKLKNGACVNLKRKKFQTLMDLLGAVSFSTSCFRLSQNIIELSFDMKNKFVISLDNLSYENEKLLELLFNGTRYGASFISNVENDNFVVDNKTLKITEFNNKKIIETSNGLKFYLDSITPGIIIEAFIRNIHTINPSEDWNNKTIIDVGGECGDTAIYYASKGAKVYAFEPIRAHYDAMLRNINLNPEIANRITPTNAAIGKDGKLKFYQSDRAEIAEGASFVYNTHGKNARTAEVDGYSLGTVYSKFNIKNVDLLKMDCKGCEFYLVDDDLRNVNYVKIEYLSFDDSHRLEDLLGLLSRNDFQYIIFRHEPVFYRSNLFSATIYAKKSRI